MATGFEKILNLIDFTIHRLGQVIEIYTKLSKQVQWIGMSKMLYSMLDLQKEQAKQLIKLRQQGNLETVFDQLDNLQPDTAVFFNDVSFLEDMNFIDFLSMVILQQEEFIKLYAYLGSLSSNQEVLHLFNSCAEDARKQRLWVLDRYELEILTLY